MTDFTLAKGLHKYEYAASLAATWVWAPAIFVSSEVACKYGWAGLLWFVIPNTLTLIIFGYVASKAMHTGALAGDAVKSSTKQKSLHNGISLLLLSCSTFVQLLGVYYLFGAWFGFPRWACAAGVLLTALLMVWKGGLRAVIRTDVAKYVAMVCCGLVLLGLSPPGSVAPTYSGIDLALSFGIPTTIGLLSAPYVDTTFWQRAKSASRKDVFKVFALSAAFFFLIPFVFGLIGLGKFDGWTIQGVQGVVFQPVLASAVFCALISTIDSNLCAVGALLGARVWVVAFAVVMTALFCFFDSLTIIDMFLIYGTLRTAAAVPTILHIFGRCDPDRLYWATLVAAIVGPVGFALCKVLGYGEWAVCFTVAALLIPLLGFKRGSSCVLGMSGSALCSGSRPDCYD